MRREKKTINRTGQFLLVSLLSTFAVGCIDMYFNMHYYDKEHKYQMGFSLLDAAVFAAAIAVAERLSFDFCGKFFAALLHDI